MRLYVIGPVTGREDLNCAAFEEARAKLEQAGYTVTMLDDWAPNPPSDEVLGALTQRMDETNMLLRAVYYQMEQIRKAVER